MNYLLCALGTVELRRQVLPVGAGRHRGRAPSRGWKRISGHSEGVEYRLSGRAGSERPVGDRRAGGNRVRSGEGERMPCSWIRYRPRRHGRPERRRPEQLSAQGSERKRMSDRLSGKYFECLARCNRPGYRANELGIIQSAPGVWI
jgi:hypothetical protein